jgi:tetratricopeptide (TPR) repeat protein
MKRTLAVIALVSLAAQAEEAVVDARVEEAQQLRRSGRRSDALTLLATVIKESAKKNDTLSKGRAEQKSGDVRLDDEDCNGAKKDYEQAAKTLSTLKDFVPRAQVLNDLGLWAKRCATPEVQKKYFEQALVAYRDAKHLKGVRLIANNLGTAWFVGGNPQKALVYFAEAASASRELGDDEGWLVVQVNVALMELLISQGKLKKECTSFTEKDKKDAGYQRALKAMKEAVDVQLRSGGAPLALCAKMGQYAPLCEPCLLP